MVKLKPIEHGFKAFVFRMFERQLKRSNSDFAPLDCSRLSHLLFIRPEKIGDMVVSFPVFDGLLRKFPHLKLSLLASPVCYPVVKDDPRFENVFLYKKQPLRDVSVLREIRRRRFDAVVDLICDDSVTAIFLSQLCAPGKPRIGVGKIKYADCYDFNYDHRLGDSGHIIDNTLKLLSAFGIDPDQVSGYAPPYINSEAERLASEVMQSVSSSNAGPVVGYNLSAGKSCRLWPNEKSRDLVQRILDSHRECRVLLFSTPSERENISELAAHFDNRVNLIPDELNIIQVSAILKHLSLLITPDTSLVHIARSFGVPVVGMYPRFMRNYMLWRPYDQQVGAVVSPTEEIKDIAVDQTFHTYQELFRQICSVTP